MHVRDTESDPSRRRSDHDTPAQPHARYHVERLELAARDDPDRLAIVMDLQAIARTIGHRAWRQRGERGPRTLPQLLRQIDALELQRLPFAPPNRSEGRPPEVSYGQEHLG